MTWHLLLSDRAHAGSGRPTSTSAARGPTMIDRWSASTGSSPGVATSLGAATDVLANTCQCCPFGSTGSSSSSASQCALKAQYTWSSSPLGPSALRITASSRLDPLQSGCQARVPCQLTSGKPQPTGSSPRGWWVLLTDGCADRNPIQQRTNRSSSPLRLTSAQSNQVSGLSWQYALLLPYWVRPTSSPLRIIGIP